MYQEKDGCILIRKEIRSTEGDGKYSLDLSLMAPEAHTVYPSG